MTSKGTTNTKIMTQLLANIQYGLPTISTCIVFIIKIEKHSTIFLLSRFVILLPYNYITQVKALYLLQYNVFIIIITAYLIKNCTCKMTCLN